jgi:hypothetical protein
MDIFQIDLIKVIIQGGAVGIAVLLIWVVYKILTNHQKHLVDVIDKNTTAWNHNTEALTKLSTTLELTHKPKRRK